MSSRQLPGYFFEEKNFARWNGLGVLFKMKDIYVKQEKFW